VTFTSPVTVQITVSNFKVGVSPASASANPGQAVSYNVTVAPQLGSFPGAVNLACSGLPALTTCLFSPASITPEANAATSTLTLATTAASALLPWHFRGWKAPPATEVMLVGVLLVLALFRKVTTHGSPESRIPNPESRHIAYAVCGVLLGLLLLQISCGGGGSGTGGGMMVNPGTPAGTYNISITGTSGTLVQTAPVTLVVQ